MKYVALALFAVVAALAGGASAQDTRPLIRYSLDNGLDVILVPDHRAPKVVVYTGFKVGSVNEPPGRSGFAHLFEHLMFSGTPANPNIDETYGTVGGDINASTWPDQTIYFVRGLSSTLPFILGVEADRFANGGAAITQESLDIQRDVVLNEMRQNTLDTLNGSAQALALSHIYPPDHPYRRQVIGSIADLKAATIEDVHGFFDTFYVPNNAILTIVGDFEPEATKALIAETFGKIPRGATPPSLSVPEFEPQRARAEMEDRDPTPRLFFTWPVGGLGTKDNSLLRVVEQLLGNEEYGVLRRALVDTGLADNAWAYQWGANLSSQFFVEVSLAEGADLAAVEAATLKALADFVSAGPSAADVAREARKVILGDRVHNEDPLNFAENILTFTIASDDPFLARDDDAHILAATPAEIIDASSRLLQSGDASLVIVRPGERGDYPEVLTASSGTAEPFTAEPRPHVDVPKLAASAPVAAALPESETATLSNGIKVVHYPMPTAAMAYLGVQSPAGTLSDPEGKEGTIELATVTATNGAGDLGPAEFGRAVSDLGSTITVQLDLYSTFINLQAPADTYGASVRLLADAVQRPRFDASEWDTVMAKTLSALGERESDVTDVSSRYALASMLPKLPGQPAIDNSIVSTKSVTREDAMAVFARVFSPKTVTFYSVGPVPLADVVAALEASFGSWTSDAEPLPAPLPRSVTIPAGGKVLLVPEPGASQSSIYVATAAPGLDDAHNAEAIATVRLLGDDFISRINSVIREDLGYTYGTAGKILDFVRSGSAMAIDAPVTRESTGAALDEMLDGYASLATEAVRDDELQRTITSTYADLAGTAETSQGLFDAIWGAMIVGSSLDEQYRVRLALTGLKLDDVVAEAEKLASTDDALIVVVGDVDIVKPQLEALGLAVEVVERNL